jgi:hypothetical protein
LLQTVPGVAEVASFGVLKTISIGFRSFENAVYNVSDGSDGRKGVIDVGGRKFEMSNMAYMAGLYKKHQRCGRNCHQNYNSVPVS